MADETPADTEGLATVTERIEHELRVAGDAARQEAVFSALLLKAGPATEHVVKQSFWCALSHGWSLEQEQLTWPLWTRFAEAALLSEIVPAPVIDGIFAFCSAPAADSPAFLDYDGWRVAILRLSIARSAAMDDAPAPTDEETRASFWLNALTDLVVQHLLPFRQDSTVEAGQSLARFFGDDELLAPVLWTYRAAVDAAFAGFSTGGVVGFPAFDKFCQEFGISPSLVSATTVSKVYAEVMRLEEQRHASKPGERPAGLPDALALVRCLSLFAVEASPESRYPTLLTFAAKLEYFLLNYLTPHRGLVPSMDLPPVDRSRAPPYFPAVAGAVPAEVPQAGGPIAIAGAELNALGLGVHVVVASPAAGSGFCITVAPGDIPPGAGEVAIELPALPVRGEAPHEALRFTAQPAEGEAAHNPAGRIHLFVERVTPVSLTVHNTRASLADRARPAPPSSTAAAAYVRPVCDSVLPAELSRFIVHLHDAAAEDPQPGSTSDPFFQPPSPQTVASSPFGAPRLQLHGGDLERSLNRLGVGAQPDDSRGLLTLDGYASVLSLFNIPDHGNVPFHAACAPHPERGLDALQFACALCHAAYLSGGPGGDIAQTLEGFFLPGLVARSYAQAVRLYAGVRRRACDRGAGAGPWGPFAPSGGGRHHTGGLLRADANNNSGSSIVDVEPYPVGNDNGAGANGGPRAGPVPASSYKNGKSNSGAGVVDVGGGNDNRAASVGDADGPRAGPVPIGDVGKSSKRTSSSGVVNVGGGGDNRADPLSLFPAGHNGSRRSIFAVPAMERLAQRGGEDPAPASTAAAARSESSGGSVAGDAAENGSTESKEPARARSARKSGARRTKSLQHRQSVRGGAEQSPKQPRRHPKWSDGNPPRALSCQAATAPPPPEQPKQQLQQQQQLLKSHAPDEAESPLLFALNPAANSSRGAKLPRTRSRGYSDLPVSHALLLSKLHKALGILQHAAPAASPPTVHSTAEPDGGSPAPFEAGTPKGRLSPLLAPGTPQSALAEGADSAFPHGPAGAARARELAAVLQQAVAVVEAACDAPEAAPADGSGAGLQRVSDASTAPRLSASRASYGSDRHGSEFHASWDQALRRQLHAKEHQLEAARLEAAALRGKLTASAEGLAGWADAAKGWARGVSEAARWLSMLVAHAHGILGGEHRLCKLGDRYCQAAAEVEEWVADSIRQLLRNGAEAGAEPVSEEAERRYAAVCAAARRDIIIYAESLYSKSPAARSAGGSHRNSNVSDPGGRLATANSISAGSNPPDDRATVYNWSGAGSRRPSSPQSDRKAPRADHPTARHPFRAARATFGSLRDSASSDEGAGGESPRERHPSDRQWPSARSARERPASAAGLAALKRELRFIRTALDAHGGGDADGNPRRRRSAPDADGDDDRAFPQHRPCFPAAATQRGAAASKGSRHDAGEGRLDSPGRGEADHLPLSPLHKPCFAASKGIRRGSEGRDAGECAASSAARLVRVCDEQGPDLSELWQEVRWIKAGLRRCRKPDDAGWPDEAGPAGRQRQQQQQHAAGLAALRREFRSIQAAARASPASNSDASDEIDVLFNSTLPLGASGRESPVPVGSAASSSRRKESLPAASETADPSGTPGSEGVGAPKEAGARVVSGSGNERRAPPAPAGQAPAAAPGGGGESASARPASRSSLRDARLGGRAPGGGSPRVQGGTPPASPAADRRVTQLRVSVDWHGRDPARDGPRLGQEAAPGQGQGQGQGAGLGHGPGQGQGQGQGAGLGQGQRQGEGPGPGQGARLGVGPVVRCGLSSPVATSHRARQAGPPAAGRDDQLLRLRRENAVLRELVTRYARKGRPLPRFNGNILTLALSELLLADAAPAPADTAPAPVPAASGGGREGDAADGDRPSKRPEAATDAGEPARARAAAAPPPATQLTMTAAKLRPRGLTLSAVADSSSAAGGGGRAAAHTVETPRSAATDDDEAAADQAPPRDPGPPAEDGGGPLRNSALHVQAVELMASQAAAVDAVVEHEASARSQRARALIRLLGARVSLKTARSARRLFACGMRARQREADCARWSHEVADSRERLSVLVQAMLWAYQGLVPGATKKAVHFSGAPPSPCAGMPSITAESVSHVVHGLATLKHWVSPGAQRQTVSAFEAKIAGLQGQIASLTKTLLDRDESRKRGSYAYGELRLPLLSPDSPRGSPKAAASSAHVHRVSVVHTPRAQASRDTSPAGSPADRRRQSSLLSSAAPAADRQNPLSDVFKRDDPTWLSPSIRESIMHSLAQSHPDIQTSVLQAVSLSVRRPTTATTARDLHKPSVPYVLSSDDCLQLVKRIHSARSARSAQSGKVFRVVRKKYILGALPDDPPPQFVSGPMPFEMEPSPNAQARRASVPQHRSSKVPTPPVKTAPAAPRTTTPPPADYPASSHSARIESEHHPEPSNILNPNKSSASLSKSEALKPVKSNTATAKPHAHRPVPRQNLASMLVNDHPSSSPTTAPRPRPGVPLLSIEPEFAPLADTSPPIPCNAKLAAESPDNLYRRLVGQPVNVPSGFKAPVRHRNKLLTAERPDDVSSIKGRGATDGQPSAGNCRGRRALVPVTTVAMHRLIRDVKHSATMPQGAAAPPS
ncbi:hypothetical protein DIPPA_10149 [Diplonema papillatum]|nr:hypothetical protein DIPPA_10149 [Diplonema papillatum]